MTAAWCLRVYNRKCSQHGDWVLLGSAEEQVGWTGVIPPGPSRPYAGQLTATHGGLCFHRAPTHVLALACGARVCFPPTPTAGKVFSPWKICHLLQKEGGGSSAVSPVPPLCNHGDRAVIMRLHSSETFNPLLGYSVCHYDLDLPKVIQQCLQHLFTCSQQEIQLLHLLSLVKQLELQSRLASLAKYHKAKHAAVTRSQLSARRDYTSIILLGLLPKRERLVNTMSLWRM